MAPSPEASEGDFHPFFSALLDPEFACLLSFLGIGPLLELEFGPLLESQLTSLGREVVLDIQLSQGLWDRQLELDRDFSGHF